MLGNRIRFETSISAANWHGPKHETLRRTWQVVRMCSYAKCWSLYIYGRNGGYLRLQITFPRWSGPWPESSGSEPRR